MQVLDFDSADRLYEYIDSNSIERANIAKIIASGGRWWLFMEDGFGSSGGGGSPTLATALPGDAVVPADAGNIRMFGRQFGGWPLLSFVDDTGLVRTSFPDLGTSRFSVGLGPDGANGTTIVPHGVPNYTRFGTAVAVHVPVPGSARAVERAYGARWSGNGGSGWCSLRNDFVNANGAHILRSQDFLFVWAGGFPEYQAGHELFVGIPNSVDANPAANYTHAIGLVCRTTDTGGQWWLMHNGGGTVTLIDLGTTLNANDHYLVAVGYRETDTTSVFATVLNTATGAALLSERLINTNLPSLTQPLHLQAGTNNQGTGASATLHQSVCEGFYGRWSPFGE